MHRSEKQTVIYRRITTLVVGITSFRDSNTADIDISRSTEYRHARHDNNTARSERPLFPQYCMLKSHKVARANNHQKLTVTEFAKRGTARTACQGHIPAGLSCHNGNTVTFTSNRQCKKYQAIITIRRSCSSLGEANALRSTHEDNQKAAAMDWYERSQPRVLGWPRWEKCKSTFSRSASQLPG